MDNRYGVNMRQFCQDHERMVEGATITKDLLERHLRKLVWLQHERLVHLIVLVMTVIGELFVVDLVLLHPQTHPTSAIIMLGLAILLAFYTAHYFFLENTVQRWYLLADKLQEELDKLS